MIIDHLRDHEEHICTLAEWIVEEWGQYLADSSVAAMSAALRKSGSDETLPVSFVAIERDRPVGLARLVEHDMDTRRDLSPWLAYVFVSPPDRRKGIATALCQRVLEHAHAIGFSECFLFTPDRENFYARRGWRVVDRISYWNKPVVIMKINLPGPLARLHCGGGG